MSLTLELRVGQRGEMFPLPGDMLSGLARLANTGYAKETQQLIGSADTRPGEERTIDRHALLRAVEQLLPAARSLPATFRVHRMTPYKDSQDPGARGLSGMLIDGVRFEISCHGDYWRLSPLGTLPAGKWLPPEMRGFHRHEPAEIQTDNMGVVKVQAWKNRRSGLANVLEQVLDLLRGASEDVVIVIVG